MAGCPRRRAQAPRRDRRVRLAVEARKLEDFEDAVLWAGETAEKRGASWKKAARQVIACLPKVVN